MPALATSRSPRPSTPPWLWTPALFSGFKNEVEQISNDYLTNGIENISKFVTDHMLDSLTICGTVEDCIRTLKRFVSCGISLPILQINPVKDNSESINDSLLLVENV